MSAKSTKRAATIARSLHKREGQAIAKLENKVSKETKSSKQEIEKSKPKPVSNKQNGVPSKKPNASRKKTSTRGPRIITNRPATKVASVSSGDGIYAHYDKFVSSINPYLQTLLDPWATVGAKIPRGALPSGTINITQRYLPSTDDNGRLFIALGVARAIKDGSSPGIAAVYSNGNACSLLPNIFKCNSSDSSLDKYSYVLGCTNFGNLDPTDLFKGTSIENLYSSQTSPIDLNPSFLGLIDQYRLVSAGAALIPTGNPLESKGIMTAGFLPYDRFQPSDDLTSITKDDLLNIPGFTQVFLNKVGGATVLYRPTDDANYEFCPLSKDTSFIVLEEQPAYSPGGMWFYIEGYEPGVTFELAITLNFELLPVENTLNIVTNVTEDDSIAIDRAMYTLGLVPPAFPGYDMAQMTAIGTINKGVVNRQLTTHQVRVATEPVTSRTSDHKFGGFGVVVAGPQARQLGGFKDFVGGIKSTFQRWRPMIDRIVNEWGPMALKLATAGVALL